MSSWTTAVLCSLADGAMQRRAILRPSAIHIFTLSEEILDRSEVA